MQLNQSDKEGYSVILVEGEIDINTSPDLRSMFEDTLANGKNKVLVDLEKCAFIDSSGVATLVEMFQNLKAKDGNLCLVGITDSIRGIFEITKLDKLFTIYTTQDEAFNS